MPKSHNHFSEAKKGLIIGFIQSGKSYREIHRLTGMSIGNISKLYKKFQKTGTVQNLKRSGRPAKVTTQIEKKVQQMISKKRDITSKEIQSKLQKDISLSDSTIRRIRKKLGYTGSKGKPIDKLSQGQKLERLRWLKKYKKSNFSGWIWSDEKPFELYKRRRLVWKAPGESVPLVSTTKYPPKVSVWAAISKKGKSDIAIWKGRQNSKKYTEILQQYLLPFINKAFKQRYIFQQDRDTTHRSRFTLQWLEKKKIRTVFTPANSPDLNPIELIWNILQARVSARNPQSEKQLIKIIKKEWALITQDEINKCINHCKSLGTQVLENEGNYCDSRRKRRT